ncbi:MAG: hypothetical protein ACLRRJ_03445 [Clostridium sp.]
MAAMILAGLLAIAVSKWLAYRLGVMAVLLYYAELGIGLPDPDTIRKYQAKVLMKTLGIKH